MKPFTDEVADDNRERVRRHAMRLQLAIGLGLSLAVGALWLEIPSPYLILGLAFAPVAIVTVLRMPFILCVSFISLSFFRLHEIFTPLKELRLPLVLAVLAIAVLAILLVTGRAKPYWRPELTVLSLFALLATIGIAFALDRPGSLQFWLDSFSKTVIMVFAIAWCARSPKDLVLAGKLFVVCGIVVASVAIWNKLHGLNLVEGTRVTIGRDTNSLLGDPNDLALVLLFPMAFAVAYMTSPRTGFVTRLLGTVGTAAIFWAILATQSRGGLLGLAAVFAVFASRLIKSRILLLAIAIGAAMALYTLDNIGGRSSGGAAEEGIDASSQGRLDAWKAAVRMAVAHPATGVGLNNFGPFYYFYTDHWDGKDMAVHSTWFGVLAETGPAGLVLFVTLVTMTVRQSVRTLSRLREARRSGVAVDPEIYALAQAVVAALAGFIVSGTFLTQAFTWPIYILIALGVAMTRFDDRGMLGEHGMAGIHDEQPA
jgi:O-antigen ligase